MLLPKNSVPFKGLHYSNECFNEDHPTLNKFSVEDSSQSSGGAFVACIWKFWKPVIEGKVG